MAERLINQPNKLAKGLALVAGYAPLGLLAALALLLTGRHWAARALPVS